MPAPTITAARDPALLPPMPRLSSVVEPTITDLVTFAAWVKALASGCNLSAAPREPANPFATLGALRVGADMLHDWLQRLQAEEERSLLLLQRLRAEANEDAAHERLMREDGEYAESYAEEIGGEDE